MLINAGSLVGTTVVTSLLGFAYWWLAARQFSPEAVGIASALVSAMMLLGNMCMLGLGTLLMGELYRQRGREASLISGALIVVGGIGGCVGLLFAVIAPYTSSNFHTMTGNIGDAVLFAIGVGFTAIALVLDQALLGLLRGGLQLWRNIWFAVAKLTTLLTMSLWLSHITGITIYATWIIGNVFSLAVLSAYTLLKKGWQGSRYLPQWSLLRGWKTAALQHHLLNSALQVPALALPVLVAALLSPTVNAWFYVSWMIVGSLSVLTPALTMALYATNPGQPGKFAQRMRLTLSLAFVTSILANCILQFGAKHILILFGHTYAEQAAWSLRILGIGIIAVIIKDHYIAVCRIQRRLVDALLLITVGVILELSGASLGARLGGLPGLSLGWVIAVWIEAALMCRTVCQTVLYTSDTGRRRGYASYHASSGTTGAFTNDSD